MSEQHNISSLPSSDDASLAGLIRHWRELRGLRQVDLAAILHVGLSTATAWERGVHEPPADALPDLAAALEVAIIADADGFRFVDLTAVPEPEPESAPEPPPPGPVVVVAGTAEAMAEALDRLGIPRAE